VNRGTWTGAALALALVTMGGPAWGQAPSAGADSLARATALVRGRDFGSAVPLLRRVILADPSNRGAQELLAFALESSGDFEGERRVRAALVAAQPGDSPLWFDYGRVLERLGDEAGALRAYRHARDLAVGASPPQIDEAIERTRGRTVPELGAPFTLVSEPDATASRTQVGAALPIGAGDQVTLLGSRQFARGRLWPEGMSSDHVALSIVHRLGIGGFVTAGPHVHVISPQGGARADVRVGGAIAGRAPLGRALEIDGKAGVDSPWDEAAIAILRGGRASSAEGNLYAHAFARRVLLQGGARRRRLTILDFGPIPARRAAARQTLWRAGADVVLWQRPGGTLRGEMLDEALIAPTATSPALTLSYRHYDVSTSATPDFAERIAIAPRARVDEVSIATTVASPRRDLGLELRGALARDAARDALVWNPGATLVWAPRASARLRLGFDQATETAAGLTGRRREARVSLHVDL
jgi:tetratricopeptide (TPR) repeat protein